MSEEKQEKERFEDRVMYLKKWTIFYPPEEEDTVKRFREFCKEYAGNKHISGIKALMYLADFQAQIAVLNREIAEIRALISQEDEKEEEGVPTLGGEAK